MAEFRLTIGMELAKAILDSKPEFKEETPRAVAGMPTPPHFYAWLAQGASEEIAKSAPIVLPGDREGQPALLGHVRLFPNVLSVETYSKSVFQSVRKLVEDYFGGEGVEFKKESIVNMGEQLLQREKLWPEENDDAQRAEGIRSARGERTISSPGTNAEAHKGRFVQLLEQPTADLDEFTPRAAARDGTLRPKLFDWLKGQIQYAEIVRRREGLDFNLDWMLDELGAPELKEAETGAAGPALISPAQPLD